MVLFKKINFCPLCKKTGRLRFTSYDYEKIPLVSYNYKYCKNCDCIFITKTPAPKFIKNLYSSDYSGYSSLGSFTKFAQNVSRRVKSNIIKKLFCGKVINTAVEVGPGLNPMLILEDNFVKKINYIDLDHFKLSKNYPKKIRFIKTFDASNALVKIKNCDLIIANQLIEHLLSPNLFLKSCYNSLNNGGILFIETPNISSFEFFLFSKSGCWGGFHSPKHFNIFSDKSLINLCKINGFKIVKHTFIFSPFLWSESFKFYLKYKNIYFLEKFFSIKNPIALLFFLFLDLILFCLNKKTSNQRIILQK